MHLSGSRDLTRSGMTNPMIRCSGNKIEIFGEMLLTRSRAQRAARSFPLCSSLYDERGAMQWYDLPRDILLPILDQLDVDDLSSLEATSWRGRQVVSPASSGVYLIAD